MSLRRRKHHLNKLTGSTLGFLDYRETNASRSTWSGRVGEQTFLSRNMENSPDLHQKDLHAHFGCVNAIEFSKEGNLLISGGDDRRVLLWDVDMVFSKRQPKVMKGEHNSNIFTLAFDNDNQKIFSAGNDSKVIIHDIATSEPLDLFYHEHAIYGVSVHPSINSVFASAGEDGQVLLYDTRAPSSSEALSITKSDSSYHSVQFHPMEPLFLLTANSKTGCALWDVRKPNEAVLTYRDKKKTISTMSARFNTNGSQIVALRRRYPPILFDTYTSHTKCQFDAKFYYNSCTMKSCCFAGDRDQFILSGSDDFNLYMWKIPGSNSEVDFVPKPHFVLKGHRSIVNQVRFNSQNFFIASSGVEKIIKLWSGLVVTGFSEEYPTMNRNVYSRDQFYEMEINQNSSHDYTHRSMDEDPRMMAFFDSLVQREIEGFTSNSDISTDEETRLRGILGGDQSSTQSEESDAESSNTDSNRYVMRTDLNFEQRCRLLKALRCCERARRSERNRAVSEVQTSEEEEGSNRSRGSNYVLQKLIARKRSLIESAKSRSRGKDSGKNTQMLQTLSVNKRIVYKRRQGICNTADENGALSFQPSSSSDSRHLAPYTIMVLQDTDHDDTSSESEIGTNTDETAESTDKISLYSGSSDTDTQDCTNINNNKVKKLDIYCNDNGENCTNIFPPNDQYSDSDSDDKIPGIFNGLKANNASNSNSKSRKKKSKTNKDNLNKSTKDRKTKRNLVVESDSDDYTTKTGDNNDFELRMKYGECSNTNKLKTHKNGHKNKSVKRKQKTTKDEISYKRQKYYILESDSDFEVSFKSSEEGAVISEIIESDCEDETNKLSNFRNHLGYIDDVKVSSGDCAMNQRTCDSFMGDPAADESLLPKLTLSNSIDSDSRESPSKILNSDSKYICNGLSNSDNELGNLSDNSECNSVNNNQNGADIEAIPIASISSYNDGELLFDVDDGSDFSLHKDIDIYFPILPNLSPSNITGKTQSKQFFNKLPNLNQNGANQISDKNELKDIVENGVDSVNLENGNSLSKKELKDITENGIDSVNLENGNSLNKIELKDITDNVIDSVKLENGNSQPKNSKVFPNPTEDRNTLPSSSSNDKESSNHISFRKKLFKKSQTNYRKRNCDEM